MNKEKPKNRGLMTEGVIRKEIPLFSISPLLGNLFQQLYNAVDSITVGNYIGAQALAVVGSNVPVINLLVSFFMGLAVGVGVIISHYFGAGKGEELYIAMHTSLALTFAAGLVMTLTGVLISPYVLQWVGTPSDVMESSVLYLCIHSLGILSVMVYSTGSGILRAMGDSRNLLYLLIVSSATNIILDILSVIVFHMGIVGAGWATLIAQIISAVLTMLLLMCTKEEHQVKLKHIRFHKYVLYEIVRLGPPNGLQNAIVSFPNVIVQSNINAFGSLAMAGCDSYTKINDFAILPVMGYPMALTASTGQNMGAKKYDRVKQGVKTGILIGVITIVRISAPLLMLGPKVLAIFSSDSTVIKYGLYMTYVLAPGYTSLVISHAFNGTIRGAGTTTVPMVVMVICWCGLCIAWILTSAPLFHDIGVVFVGWLLTWTTSALWLLLYYRKGKRMTCYHF